MNRKQKKLLDKHRNPLMYIEGKGKSVEKAISLFKKRVKNANLMKQIRDNEFYEKPSAKRSRKKAEGSKRVRKDMLKRFEREGY